MNIEIFNKKSEKVLVLFDVIVEDKEKWVVTRHKNLNLNDFRVFSKGTFTVVEIT